MSDNEFWGYHLILDCKSGRKDLITNPSYISEFAKTLVKSIKMKAFGEPQVVHFAGDVPGIGGITLIQLIETSNITCHFIDDTGDFYLDVFSCACYDNDIVIKLIEAWFQPLSIKATFINRKA